MKAAFAVTKPASRPRTIVPTLVASAASASDNVGVAGVRFLVDGVSLGEDISAPFSVSWNTGGAANGTHMLTATARDAAGNLKTTTVSVSVQNTKTRGRKNKV